MASETQEILTGDLPSTATVRSRGASDRFAGLPIAQAALEFASTRHANEYREFDGAPFIAHPIEVGRLLDRHGQPDDVIAAGLPHDTLEKTATTRFGRRPAPAKVTRLRLFVDGCRWWRWTPALG